MCLCMPSRSHITISFRLKTAAGSFRNANQCRWLESCRGIRVSLAGMRSAVAATAASSSFQLFSARLQKVLVKPACFEISPLSRSLWAIVRHILPRTPFQRACLLPPAYIRGNLCHPHYHQPGCHSSVPPDPLYGLGIRFSRVLLPRKVFKTLQFNVYLPSSG